MDEDRIERVKAASNPRRATLDDVSVLSRLFASTFVTDPIIDYMVPPGAGREAAVERLFRFLLYKRDIPQGEVWMSPDGHACTMWLPPDARRSARGVVEKLRLLPLLVSIFGFGGLARAGAITEAMEKNHPTDRHFYLAFVAVSARYQGTGLGSAILGANLKRIDDVGAAAYLENSNPKNTRLYERFGFIAGKDISPGDAPPLIAMWRPPVPRRA